MERANQVLRRGGVKLKCLNSGHSDLNMIISDVKEIRSAFKNFHTAQVTTWQDMAKWASKEKTIAFQEVLNILLELCFLWSEVQLDFLAGLKKFKHQFELILESETLLDKSKSHLNSCEYRDNKISKELTKANSKGNVEEVKQLSVRQLETQAHVKVAQAEVKSKALENEAVKLMLVKEGLLNLSSCYLELADKASMIFRAHKEVANTLPDVHDRDIEDIRYPGSEIGRNILMKTKESVHCYKKSTEAESAPPPYTISPFMQRPLNFSSCTGNSSLNSFTFPVNLPHSPESIGYNCDIRPPDYPPQYELPPLDNYENLEGAVGGIASDDNCSIRHTSI